MNTILVVEDELSLRRALRDKLSLENMQVLEAQDGAEGLTLAIQKKPDLILLDVIMPVMDGMTMLKKLRQDAWGKTARVVLLTNLSDAEMVNEALAQGTHDYLVKTDWTLKDLVTKIRQLLKA